MTVTENVVLSEAGLGPVDLNAARGRVLEAADLLGVTVDPDARVADLSVGEQQRVEILKALFRKCRVLVLDEPTAVLVPQDAEALFASVRRLTAAGLAVLFISHKLHEVTAVSTRVSVLRRGRIVDTVPAAGASPRELAELMVGRPTLGVRRADAPVADADLAVASTSGVAAGASGVAAGPGTAVLEVDGLVVAGRGERPAVDGVSLVVRSGEILGIAGVSGNGQSELVAALCGMRPPAAGSARVAGVDITGASPTAVMAAGLGRIPEDRHGSVVGALAVEDNLVLEDLAPYRRGPFLDRRRVRRHAEELIERYAIKAKPTDAVQTLSGGNMQKVLLARVLSRNPRAVVVAQPTRGLDVGATEYVHRELLAQRGRGTAVLLVSEDLEELLALCDRVVVMFEGRIVGEVPAGQATRAELGLLMAGEAA